MTHATRQSLKPMVAGLAAAFLGVISSALIKKNDYPLTIDVIISLLPLPAYAWLMVSIIQGVRAMDEMQRRIQLEAAAICLVSTAMITIGYGFLGLAGAPQPNWAFVACLMAGLYTVGYVVAARHYR